MPATIQQVLILALLLAFSPLAAAADDRIESTTHGGFEVLGTQVRDLLTVPGDYATIQAAINAATNGDTIRVSAGTYLENIDFIGKAITLESEDGPAATVIDGGQVYSVVIFHNGEGNDSVLDGFTITNGHFPLGLGGGIFCTGTGPTIQGNIISHNLTDHPGAGIYCNNGSPVIRDNLISNNIAGTQGGGISCWDSEPIIDGNRIETNTAQYGGGIYCSRCTVTITGNTVIDNTATWGGGGYLSQSDGTGDQNRIRENYAHDAGGGFYLFESSPSMDNNRIFLNAAFNYGGGMEVYHLSVPYISNTVIAGNEAKFGAGIHCRDQSPAIITYSTVADNTAGVGGGGLRSYQSTPFLKSMVFWGNNAPQGPQIQAVSGDPFVSFSDVQGGWIGTGNINGDPLFRDAPMLDYHLTRFSPCIDAGDHNVPNPVDKDMDGQGRMVDFPRNYLIGDPVLTPRVDMGADEFWGRGVKSVPVAPVTK